MPLQRKFRNELGNVIVQREFAALYLLHYRNSGEWQHWPDDVIHSLILCRRFQCEIGKAIAFVQQNAVTSRTSTDAPTTRSCAMTRWTMASDRRRSDRQANSCPATHWRGAEKQYDDRGKCWLGNG